METFAAYLLKSVIWTSGFTLVFILFLRNERFFSLNRIYLLAGILTSFIFPLISIHYTVELPVIKNFQSGTEVINQVHEPVRNIIPDLKLLITVLYISGILFVSIPILKRAGTIVRAIRKSEIISLNQVKLIKTPDYTSAFSFFSYVFVNPSVIDIEAKEILNHELVHIRQKHWFDLLLADLLCIMQWFNPLVWIYVRSIRQNHEYLADAMALQQTSDPAVYRAVLLNQIVGAPVVSLTNSFNYSLNKKRFNMMKNIMSSPYRKMKILLILPVFAIVLYSFAKPDYKYKYVDESSVNNISRISLVQKSVKGIVVQPDRKPLEGAIVILKGTTIGTISDVNGNFRLDNVPDDGLLVVTFVGFKSKVLKPVFTSDMTITLMRDTVKYMNLNIDTPPPPPPPTGNINAVTPLPPVKSNSNIDNTPPPPPPPLMNPMENGNNWKNYINPDSLGKLLVVIDGVVSEKDGMSKISMDEIASMSVLAKVPAVRKYGEKGKNGVIEIITKQGKNGVIEEIITKRDDRQLGVAVNAIPAEKAKEPIIVTKETPVAEKIEKDKYVVVEAYPEFPGGKDAMTTWIAANIKYPAEAMKGKIEGKVYVSFTVSASGKVKDAVVTKSASPSLNAEAIRVISSMPDWKPGSQAGKSVNVQLQVPVEFKLE